MATQLEKSRYLCFADWSNVISQDVSVFDNCNLSNVKVYLNSEFYPYDDQNLDFDKKRYAVLIYTPVFVKHIMESIVQLCSRLSRKDLLRSLIVRID